MKINEAKRDQRNVNVNTIYEMKAERKIRDMKQKKVPQQSAKRQPA